VKICFDVCGIAGQKRTADLQVCFIYLPVVSDKAFRKYFSTTTKKGNVPVFVHSLLTSFADGQPICKFCRSVPHRQTSWTRAR